MHLDRVRITGADDSIVPEALLLLSQAYPWVEWGILVSATHNKGEPRFPAAQWIAELQYLAKKHPMHLSLHLCGKWARELLLGLQKIPDGLLEGFSRVQLNFAGTLLARHTGKCCLALRTLGARQIIFQLDGMLGHVHLAAVCEQDAILQSVDAVPLFDISGGTGLLPYAWPAPILRYAYHGYAGGLGPENLAGQLPLIAAAAGDARVWVDME